MGMNDFFGSVELLHRSMDVASLRYQVTANNIANSETPKYKKQYVNFESELKRAFESEENAKANPFKLTVTNPLHFGTPEGKNWLDVEPRRVTDWSTSVKANGNNVDAEEEAMNLVQIQEQYRLLTQLTSFQFSQLDVAMRSSK